MNSAENHPVVSDEELCLSAQSGDENAVNTLLYRYASIVRNRASGYYGADCSPEDLAQEGMIGLYSAIKGFSSVKGASFRTFAILCIDRSIISAVRSALSKKNIPVDAVVPLDFAADEGGISAEDVVLSNESLRELREIMAKRLTEKESRVMMLRLGGCGYGEISAKTGLSEKSVDNILYRVRKKLKGFS